MQNREVLNVETLFSTQIKPSNPVQSSEFDLHSGAHEVLKGVGLTTADSGGQRRRDSISSWSLFIWKHGFS